MGRTDTYFIIVILLISMSIIYQLKNGESTVIAERPNQPLVVDPEPLKPEIKPEPPKRVEPVFINWPKVRSVDGNLGKVLGDIEAHMPAGHIYKDSDKITWGHETTHGINSNIRNRNQKWVVAYTKPFFFFRKKYLVKSAERVNGFYCLEDRAAVIIEPPTTIRAAAAKVPQSLRGGVYQLYLVQQAGGWNDTPLYIFDEWVAYTNGSEVRKDLGITSRAETVTYMMEFNVYAMSLAMVVKEKGGYDDTQFKAFLMWNIERSVRIYNSEVEATAYLNKLRNNSDAENLRSFARSYFGAEWCKEIIGF